MENAANTSPRLVTVAQMAQTAPYSAIYKEAGIRHLIWNARPGETTDGRVFRKPNGLIEAGALIQIGRKLLIDLDRFDAWVRSHTVKQ